MKALVIEDRKAMEQMFCGTLEKFGFETKVSSTVAEAIEDNSSFHPDLVILDSSIENGSGTDYLTALIPVEEVNETRKERKKKMEGAPILVVRTANDVVPTDCPFIKASLVRPFTTDQLLECIKEIISEDDIERAVSEKRSFRKKDGDSDHEVLSDKSKKRLSKLYSDTPAIDPKVELARMGMIYGESYVFFEEQPIVIHQAVQIFANAGYDMFLLTPVRAKVARERFGLDIGTEVFTLSGSKYPIGTMIEAVKNFVRTKKMPLVAIGDLDNIIQQCGIDITLRAIRQILSFRDDKTRFTLLVSVDDSLLVANIRNLLVEMMTEYKES